MIIHVKGDVIALKGSLAENQWPALRSAVSLLLKKHPSGVIVEGGDLTDISDVGTHTFIDASEYLQAQNARVVFAGLSQHIQERMSRIPGARSQMPLAASVEEARASLAVGDIGTLPESARRPVILVPLLGAWHQAIEYAAMHSGRKAEIHLLYVIEVPRSLPLGVPLPDQEHEALRILSQAEQAMGRSGVTVRRMITRARAGIEGAAKFAADTNPRLVVAAFAKEELQRETDGQDVIAALAGEATGDVVIYCVRSPSEAGVTEARPPCKPVILVPMFGAWVRAIGFAAEQASPAKKEIHLLYVLQVPRVSPLDVSIPEKEREAEQLLSEAERALKRSRVVVRKFTTRARDIMEGAGKFAEETQPELVTVAYYRDELIERGARFGIVTTLCHEAPCDVAVFCAKPE